MSLNHNSWDNNVTLHFRCLDLYNTFFFSAFDTFCSCLGEPLNISGNKSYLGNKQQGQNIKQQTERQIRTCSRNMLTFISQLYSVLSRKKIASFLVTSWNQSSRYSVRYRDYNLNKLRDKLLPVLDLLGLLILHKGIKLG